MALNEMKRFSGKVALIVGSTRGIGFSTAQRLASEGAKVIICGREESQVQEATKKLTDLGYTVKGIACHVCDKDKRKELLQQVVDFGGLDILMINAGINPEMGGVFDCPESVWDKTFDVNVKAAFLLSKEALPLLKRSKAGRIIYMSSASTYNVNELLGVYGVSKTALLGLTKAAAIQLGKYNITVNSVCPGVIDTKFGEFVMHDDQLSQYYLSLVALKRFGTVEDVSAAVAFLASDEASYITGENIPIAGGMFSKL